jgi:hypothetical protein
MMDLSSVPDSLVEELHKEGVLCLQGTLQLAVAADQRATTLTGVFGAGSVALLAAAATLLTVSQPNQPLLLGAIATAIFLLSAALFCAWAARPVDFFLVGYEPKLLAPAARDRGWMLRCTTEDIQMRIDANRRVISRSALILKFGFLIAVCSVPAGIIAFWAARHLS